MTDIQAKPVGGTFRLSLVAAACLGVAACSSQRFIDERRPVWSRDLGVQQETEVAEDAIPRAAAARTTPVPPARDNSFYKPGTGQLVAPSGDGSIAEAADTEGGIKLNFQNANLLEVVKVVLGDMLGATYVIDPRVQGSVTMQTSRPLSRADLVPTLELLLRMNDAAIILEGEVYRIVPLATAVTGVQAPQLGDSDVPLPRGYSVRVVPLKYVAAEEMAQILEPFIAGGNNLLRTDSKRNVIILAGDGSDMVRLLETIRVFDVDRMKGMSVAMFTPAFVDAKTLGEELEALLADPESGLMAGLVRFLVIERLNGLMVVTPRPEYLAQVRNWVQRLDKDGGGSGQRLFVYRVANGKAAELAETLNQLFESERREEARPPQLAPGLRPAVTRSRPTDEESPGETPRTPLGLTGGAEGVAISEMTQVRVIADEPNNALLILCTAQEYQQILSALRQMDIVPLQVLIDVTIAEVTLSDDLRYGVEWFFTNNIRSSRGNYRGIGALDLATAGIAPLTGFSYALQGASGDINFVLNMLASESNLSVLSSPSLLVLNNQEARIQVGDEVPVATQQQQSTTGTIIDDGGAVGTPPIINSIEYRETGVVLEVKPRVNPGGLVIMEVRQEVSLAPDVVDQSLTPRIQKREITSTVAVQSGDTIILGGLIRDNRDQAETGVPGLHTVPILGPLFGTKQDNQNRTELLVLITPRAIPDRNSALQVTEEFRRKLNSLIPIEEATPASDPTASAGQKPAAGDEQDRPGGF